MIRVSLISDITKVNNNVQFDQGADMFRIALTLLAGLVPSPILCPLINQRLLHLGLALVALAQDSNSTGLPPATEEPPATEGPPSSGEPNCSEDGPGNYVYPDNCRKYWNCDNNGVLSTQVCQQDWLYRLVRWLRPEVA